VANISQTRADVSLESPGPIGAGVGGEVFDQGQPIYFSSGKWYLSDANDTAAKAEAESISLTPCKGDGRYFAYARPGSDIDLGATLEPGEVYVVSATAGAICPVGDLLPGEYVKVLGTARTDSVLAFNPTIPTTQLTPTTTTTTTTTS
jgi:hypothetical protein